MTPSLQKFRNLKDILPFAILGRSHSNLLNKKMLVIHYIVHMFSPVIHTSYLFILCLLIVIDHSLSYALFDYLFYLINCF